MASPMMTSRSFSVDKWAGDDIQVRVPSVIVVDSWG